MLSVGNLKIKSSLFGNDIKDLMQDLPSFKFQVSSNQYANGFMPRIP